MKTGYQHGGLPFDKLKFQKKLQEYEDLLMKIKNMKL